MAGKFPDDTKLGGAADSLEGQEALQRYMGRLEHWAVISCMKLNKSKCRILQLGWNNARYKGKLREQWLESSPAKGVWGCWLTGGSNSQQPSLTAKRGNCILGGMKHSTTSWSKEVITPLDLALVWPHLGYCV